MATVAHVRVQIQSGARTETELFQWYDADGNLLNPQETPYQAGQIQVAEWDYPINSSGKLVVTAGNSSGAIQYSTTFNTGAPENPPPVDPPPGELPEPGQLTVLPMTYIEQ